MSRVDEQSKQRAAKILAANRTPRFVKLDTLERYVHGNQYEGKPVFWDDSVGVFDRSPCVIYPIVWDAICSYVDLVLGDGRFPTITSLPGEDSENFDDDLGLGEDDSETIDRGIVAIFKQVRAQSVFAEILADAQTFGTAVIIGCIRNGRLCIETAEAKWCTADFDETDPAVVKRLEIKWTDSKEEYDERAHKWVVKVYLCKRVIDDKTDTVFKPVEAQESGVEPANWPKQSSVAHGLGFCPVRWYRYASKSSIMLPVDGRALHDHLLDEIDALNFSLSQRHRASLYAGDPQLVETGVDEDVNPAPMGQQAMGMYAAPLGGTPDHLNNMGWRSPAVPKNSVGTAGIGRKKGPGVIYRYPSEKSKLELLTLPGDALKSVDDNAKGLFKLLYEALSYVSLDPESMKLSGDLSGRFMEWLHRKQLNRCDKIRLDFVDHCILPVLDMLFRIVIAKSGDKGLRLAGADKLAAVLRKFEQRVQGADGKTTTQWIMPELHSKWPPYFQSTDADQKLLGDNVRADLEASIITKRTALEKLAPFYGIKNVSEYLESLEQEAQEKMAAMHDAAAALQSVGGESDEEPQDDNAPPPPKQKNPIAPKAKAPKALPPPKPARKASKRKPSPQATA